MTVERISDDGLFRREWMFSFEVRRGQVQISLSLYRESQRPTKRHAFRQTQIYIATFDQRKNTMARGDIDIPSDVQDEALELVRQSVVFV